MRSGPRSGTPLRPAVIVPVCLLLLVSAAPPLDAQDFPYLRALISGARAAPRVTAEDVARESIVELAREQIGTPYRYGSSSPDRGFDCSGLVLYVMNQLGFTLPRTAALQSRAGEEVVRDRAELRPGDLLTFGGGSRITHIGIYSGNGRYIHASTRRGQVVEAMLPTSSYWRGVRRLVVAQEPQPGGEGG
jgi:cell wall-associated NlpC family hydrolase